MADRDADDGEKYAQRPDSLRQLRACKTCKLVKTIDQVRISGVAAAVADSRHAEVQPNQHANV